MDNKTKTMKGNIMPRKITNDDLKNRRDLNAWKIELDGYKMADTHSKHAAAVAELAKREEKRIGALKDTLWETAVPYFGINISPEELKAKFELIMNDSRNAGIVRQLKENEEQRLRALEADDINRVDDLKSKHAKLIDELNKEKEKAESNSDEESPASEEDITDKPKISKT